MGTPQRLPVHGNMVGDLVFDRDVKGDKFGMALHRTDNSNYQ